MKTLSFVWGVIYLAFSMLVIGMFLYGSYLAFSASVIMGLVGLVIPPFSTILGLFGFFGHPEVAQTIFNLVTGAH